MNYILLRTKMTNLSIFIANKREFFIIYLFNLIKVWNIQNYLNIYKNI